MISRHNYYFSMDTLQLESEVYPDPIAIFTLSADHERWLSTIFAEPADASPANNILEIDSDKWQLPPYPDTKKPNWLFEPYARCGNHVCSYYHIVFQLCNRIIQYTFQLSLNEVRSMRRKIYGQNCYVRVLAKHGYEILAKCLDFMNRANLDKTAISSLISKIKRKGYATNLVISFVKNFHLFMQQLVTHNPDLADVVLTAISTSS